MSGRATGSGTDITGRPERIGRWQRRRARVVWEVGGPGGARHSERKGRATGMVAGRSGALVIGALAAIGIQEEEGNPISIPW
jgi:hypothetical protein